MNQVRLSAPTLKVLKALLEKPQQGQSGAALSQATKVGSGTLYPMLARLEGAGWLTGEWEDIDPREAGRPRRRFYKLSGFGQAEALKAFREVQLVGGLAWNS
jgi:PadR family transcriptional regulator, regulatory protein PadR